MDADEENVQMTVKNDVSTIKNKISDFVTKFNDVYSYIKTRYPSDKTSRGLFTGDSTAMSLMKNLQNNVMSSVSGLSSDNLSYLGQIGIKFDPAMGLSISDSSQLETQLANNPSQVADLFNSTDGIASRLYNITYQYLGSDGTISRIKYSIDNNIKYLNDKMEYLTTAIDKSAANLRKQYEKLQIQYSTMLSAYSSYSSMNSGYY